MQYSKKSAEAAYPCLEIDDKTWNRINDFVRLNQDTNPIKWKEAKSFGFISGTLIRCI